MYLQLLKEEQEVNGKLQAQTLMKNISTLNWINVNSLLQDNFKNSIQRWSGNRFEKDFAQLKPVWQTSFKLVWVQCKLGYR